MKKVLQMMMVATLINGVAQVQAVSYEYYQKTLVDFRNHTDKLTGSTYESLSPMKRQQVINESETFLSGVSPLSQFENEVDYKKFKQILNNRKKEMALGDVDYTGVKELFKEPDAFDEEFARLAEIDNPFKEDKPSKEDKPKVLEEKDKTVTVEPLDYTKSGAALGLLTSEERFVVFRDLFNEETKKISEFVNNPNVQKLIEEVDDADDTQIITDDLIVYLSKSKHYGTQLYQGFKRLEKNISHTLAGYQEELSDELIKLLAERDVKGDKTVGEFIADENKQKAANRVLITLYQELYSYLIGISEVYDHLNGGYPIDMKDGEGKRSIVAIVMDKDLDMMALVPEDEGKEKLKEIIRDQFTPEAKAGDSNARQQQMLDGIIQYIQDNNDLPQDELQYLVRIYVTISIARLDNLLTALSDFIIGKDIRLVYKLEKAMKPFEK